MFGVPVRTKRVRSLDIIKNKLTPYSRRDLNVCIETSLVKQCIEVKLIGPVCLFCVLKAFVPFNHQATKLELLNLTYCFKWSQGSVFAFSFSAMFFETSPLEFQGPLVIFIRPQNTSYSFRNSRERHNFKHRLNMLFGHLWPIGDPQISHNWSWSYCVSLKSSFWWLMYLIDPSWVGSVSARNLWMQIAPKLEITKLHLKFCPYFALRNGSSRI